MTKEIDHATCSARLRAYVAGDLDERTAAAVSRHLESCPRCTGERKAVALLQDEPPPLSSDERARLHEAVREKVSGRGRAAPILPWRRRLAPALAAAAVLAALAVGVPLLLTGGGSSGLDAGGGAAGGRGVADAVRESTQAGGSESAAPKARATVSRPRFEPSAGALSRAELRRLGRHAPLEHAPLERAYTVASGDAAALGEELAKRLVRHAPPQVADQVRECVEVVRRNSPAALPVRGAAGTLDGADVVVVAFARGAGGRGPPDGYQVWVWPQGSCDAPVSFQAGRAR